VLLDSDLATLYEVLTKNLNLAVRRNRERFPGDFMFQLTAKELEWRQFEQAGQIETVFQTIQQLIEAPAEEPVEPKRRVGFPTANEDRGTTE
jgi:hypothetical protein